jgi:hypothetical protein
VKHVIFYSWQSDLDPALTRNFVEDALTRTLKSLNRDQDSSSKPLSTEIRRASRGLPESLRRFSKR